MPEMPCHIRRDALRTWLNESAVRAASMRNRASVGLERMSDIAAAYAAEGVYDPTDCCGRALSVWADGDHWRLAFESRSQDDEEEAQRRVDNIDCSAVPADWNHQCESAENGLNNLDWYLNYKDQELGPLEAYWDQIASGCPVPAPLVPPPPPPPPPPPNSPPPPGPPPP